MAAMTDTKHTPTPWAVEVNDRSVAVWSKFKSQKTGDDGDDRHVVAIPDWGPLEKRTADAAFIVHACNNIERVEAENAKLKKHNSELLRAARNLLTYRYCLKDGAGREETNAGIERACAALAKAQEGA